MLAAIYSKSGGARAVLNLGEFRRIGIWLSRDVLSEVEANISKLGADLLPELAVLLAAADVSIADPPAALTAQRLNRYVNYAPDAVILAAAQECGSAYFVTLDRVHILRNQDLPKALTFELGTPGEFLAWYRSKFAATL